MQTIITWFTWITWFPSAGSHEQTLPMVLRGTKLKTYYTHLSGAFLTNTYNVSDLVLSIPLFCTPIFRAYSYKCVAQFGPQSSYL